MLHVTVLTYDLGVNNVVRQLRAFELKLFDRLDSATALVSLYVVPSPEIDISKSKSLILDLNRKG